MAKKQFDYLSMTNRIAVCREYAELWQSFFQLFSEELEDVEVTQQMEEEFENLANLLAVNHYKFEQLCGDYMTDAGAVMDVLSEAATLQGIKNMPEATISKLMVNWHTTFIDMNKAIGKMFAKLTPKELEAMQQAEQEEQEAPSHQSA